MMQQHGGEYTLYNSRSSVTHVIASNLCNAKLSDMGYVRLALLSHLIFHAPSLQKVVSPQWITDRLVRSALALSLHDHHV